MFNASNLLRTAANVERERAMNSVFGSVQMSWKEYLSLDIRLVTTGHLLCQGTQLVLLSQRQLEFCYLRLYEEHRQTVAVVGTLPSWSSAAQVGKDTEPYQLINTYGYKFDNGILVPDKSNVR